MFLYMEIGGVMERYSGRRADGENGKRRKRCDEAPCGNGLQQSRSSVLKSAFRWRLKMEAHETSWCGSNREECDLLRNPHVRHHNYAGNSPKWFRNL